MTTPANTAAIPLTEFDAEMTSTRRLLERVPNDRMAWKPHPKSFALGHLAQLVAAIPGWIAVTLREPKIDLGAQSAYGDPSDMKSEALVEAFDRNVRDAREALGAVTGDALDASWSLTRGEQVLMTMPRGAAARQHLSHLVHHRGQLTVYARLVDVPVPSIYGPTADERW